MSSTDGCGPIVAIGATLGAHACRHHERTRCSAACAACVLEPGLPGLVNGLREVNETHAIRFRNRSSAGADPDLSPECSAAVGNVKTRVQGLSVRQVPRWPPGSPRFQ